MNDLIKRCIQGDLEALGMLVEEYNDMAVRTAFLVTGHRDIAEDIAQEAFIQCFYSLKKLKDINYFKTWFYSILLRTSWKMSSKYRGELPVDIMEYEKIITLYDDNNPATSVESRAESKLIFQAVNNLKEPFKTVIVLYYYNDFSIKEISQILSCNESTIKTRLHKARKKLENIIRKSGWEISYVENTINGRENDLNGKSSTI